MENVIAELVNAILTLSGKTALKKNAQIVLVMEFVKMTDSVNVIPTLSGKTAQFVNNKKEFHKYVNCSLSK